VGARIRFGAETHPVLARPPTRTPGVAPHWYAGCPHGTIVGKTRTGDQTMPTTIDTSTARTVTLPAVPGCTGALTGPPRRRTARTTREHHPTRFQPGNRAWAARRSPGRRRRFADPDALEAACIGYFEWCAANPLIRHEPIVWRGRLTTMLAVPRMRALTLAGLYVHLGIGRSTWRDYRARPAFSPVIEWAENTVWVNQFEGAAAGLLDARIVARTLGTGTR